MSEASSSKPLILREGEGTACVGDSCYTLWGAYQRVRETFLSHHPDGDVGLLERAYKAGRNAHSNQRRKSGEPYFFHPLAVAQSLAEWRLDAVSIACALLHDTVEDTLMTLEEVRAQFGEEISVIVDGLTKLSKLDFTDRALLNAVVTSTLVFEGEGRVREYVGGYDDWVRQRPAPCPPPARPFKLPEPRRPSETRRTTGKLSYKDQRELDALPARIESLEAELEELHARLADPALYQGGGEAVAAARDRMTALEAELAEVYLRWESLETRGLS